MGRIVLIGLLLLVAAALFTWPSLDCVPPVAAWRSPNGGAAVTVCRRTYAFDSASSGQGGDAPGFAVLRVGGRIAGVVSLGTMLGATEAPPVWGINRVILPLIAEFDLPAIRPTLGADLMWQIRTALGRIPHSTEFR